MSEDKALVQRLRDFVIAEDIDLAADRIEALTAENERLREALGVAKMWSDKDWVGYEIVCKALAGAKE